MNHDVAHCIDYSEFCPKSCFYVKLQKDLKNVKDEYIKISYIHFLNSEVCPRAVLATNALKDLLAKIREENSMSDRMNFPDTVDEFMKQYQIIDTEEVYTNGAELIPVFRMKQWFEHLSSAQPEQRWIPCSECERRCVKWENSKTFPE